MANKFRWVRGDTNPKMMRVEAAHSIEIGDLVYLDTDSVRKAGDAADVGLKAANQEAFHHLFVGVAMQQKLSTEAEKEIRVATAGVFRFDCDAATFEPGDLVGMEDVVADGQLEDQKVDGVAAANLSIGKVAKRYGSNTTTVEVEVRSTLFHEGVQAVQ